MSGYAQYSARYRGTDYDACLYHDIDYNGPLVRLYSEQVMEKFEQVHPSLYVREVGLDECDAVLYSRTVCSWRGYEFVIVDSSDKSITIELSQDNAELAERLGLKRVERGVYRTEIVQADLRSVRADTTIIYLAPQES